MNGQSLEVFLVSSDYFLGEFDREERTFFRTKIVIRALLVQEYARTWKAMLGD